MVFELTVGWRKHLSSSWCQSNVSSLNSWYDILRRIISYVQQQERPVEAGSGKDGVCVFYVSLFLRSAGWKSCVGLTGPSISTPSQHGFCWSSYNVAWLPGSRGQGLCLSQCRTFWRSGGVGVTGFLRPEVHPLFGLTIGSSLIHKCFQYKSMYCLI